MAYYSTVDAIVNIRILNYHSEKPSLGDIYDALTSQLNVDGIEFDVMTMGPSYISPILKEDELISTLPFGTHFDVFIDGDGSPVQHPTEPRAVLKGDTEILQKFWSTCFDDFEKIDDAFISVPDTITEETFLDFLEEYMNS